MKPTQSAGRSLPDGPQTASRLKVFLKPGEWGVGDHRHRFHTLLGSCVSITLWHPAHKVGAMSHFLLACRGHRPQPPGSVIALDARYGDEALALMLHGLGALGVDPVECQAKIFGGGDMFPALVSSLPDGVGRRNGEAARAMLEGQGILVSSESLFGIGHRKIIFDVESGDVWARQVDLQPSAKGHS